MIEDTDTGAGAAKHESENPEHVGSAGEDVKIPFDASSVLPPEVADIVKPNGVNVLLRLDQAPTMQGMIHLPQAMKSLEFITAGILAKGPECKFVQVGDRVVVARKAIINGDAGIVLEGVRLHFTQENLIVAVVGKA